MRILVCIDASPHSRSALQALQLRRHSENSVLKLITAVESAESHFFHLGPKQSSAILEENRQSASQLLNEAAEHLNKTNDFKRIELEIVHGHPKSALLEAAEKWQANLIVTGARSARQGDPLSMGSVSQTVLEHSLCPVLVARQIAEESQPHINILLPMDHSAYSAAAAEWALQQHWSKQVRIYIISVLPAITHSYTVEDNVEKAAKYLHEYEELQRATLKRLNSWRDKFNARFGTGSAKCELLYGEARNVILAASIALPAHLIIMGSHGHTGITRFLLGSVSRAVSLKAECCVEVIRPHGR
ncbi:MAG: universal stress protein [Candidatus Obscuribacterales bacterium]|nr:universal stress protein [Candidatus Obscuribacterales bacterium]